MRLVRTFHPVGHGAFYTEQFYEGSVCKFTAVYDCGGNPEGGMDAYLDKNFSGQKINYLFISHLHWDHISGIQSLLDKNNIDELKIYLPLLTPERIIEAYVYNHENSEGNLGGDANDSIINFYTGKIREKIFEVLPEGEARSAEASDTPKISFGEALPVQSSGWIYYPYNTHDELSGVFAEYINGDKTVNFSKLKECCETNIKVLKDEYKKVGHFNEYSMTVYSGYKNPDSFLNFIINGGCHSIDYLCCNIDKISFYNTPNCLYTGDYVANEEKVSKLKSFYGEYFFSSPTLQMPHHGSDKVGGGKERYGLTLFSNRKYVVMSIKYGQYAGIPSEYLLSELKQRKLTPQIVTEKRNSCFEKVFRVFLIIK